MTRHRSRGRGPVGRSVMKGVEPVTPTRSPAILPRGYATKRPCLDCPAVEGEPCRSATGKVMSQVHISRKRVAIRDYRAELEAKTDE